ncbi:MAG: hypothetical protein KDI66_17065, partial [Xanthomonadales bacterium]|nr:hypothetical protein [Xanthomonadales bacterium]
MLLTLGGAGFGTPAAAASWSCLDHRDVVVEGESPRVLRLSAAERAAPVIIEERGGELLMSIDDKGFRHLTYPMTRYAWRWLEPMEDSTQIQLKAGSTADTIARIHTRCTLPDESRRAWLTKAQSLADSIDRHVQANPHMADFDRLVDSAPTPADRVAAMHMRALVWFLLNDYLSSARAFAEVGPMWLALGDRTR